MNDTAINEQKLLISKSRPTKGLAMETRPHFTVDTMTQLPNFFAFLPKMEEALQRGRGTLLCVDVKDLSSLNQRLGWAAGDLVISSVVEILFGPVVQEFLTGLEPSESPRLSVFRTGGDEFVALFPDRSKEEVRLLGGRIEEAFGLMMKESGIDANGLHVAAIEYPVGAGSLAEVFVAIGVAANGRELNAAAMPPWFLSVLDEMVLRIKETVTLLDAALDAAHTDTVSGLPNHRAGDQVLRATLAECEAGGRDCAVLFIDGDNLKSYNTLFGYEGGNEMIRRLGQVIQGNIRTGDFACRWLSGDEFLVVLPGAARREATAVAERIRLQVWEESADWAQRVTVSVGVATTETEGWDADRLLQKAIDANFQAKNAGKNLVV